jgi:phage head maturation protease
MAKKPKKPKKRKPTSFRDTLVQKHLTGVLRKTGAATSTMAAGRTRTWMFTTSDVDRDGQVIEPDGWSFADFIRTGCPIQFAHDYASLPIGKGSNIRRSGNGWLIDIEFFDTPDGNAALALADAGVLSVSVGFQASESVYDPALKNTRFLAQSLAEISIVPVPSNPFAVMQRATALGREAAALVRKMLKDDAAGDAFTVEGIRALRQASMAVHQLLREGNQDDQDIDVVSPSMSDDDADAVLWLDDDEPAPARSWARRRRGTKEGRTHSAATLALVKTIHDAHNKIHRAAVDPTCARCATMNMTTAPADLVDDDTTDVPGRPNVAAISTAITRALSRELRAKIDAATWVPSADPLADLAARRWRRS